MSTTGKTDPEAVKEYREALQKCDKCEIRAGKRFLCSYHEGYEDGFEAGQRNTIKAHCMGSKFPDREK